MSGAELARLAELRARMVAQRAPRSVAMLDALIAKWTAMSQAAR